MAVLDWSQCSAVESVPGRLSGAWVLKGTRMPVSAIFENIEAGASITYKEPTSNWMMMIALLALFATVLARVRPPLWMLLGSPLLFASLLLSYRRSFWIAFVLAALLVLLLGLSPLGRRLLLPVALGIGVAIWLAGSVQFQSQLPVIKRVASLQPSRVEANVEDRYRLDERANVLAEIGRHPITGLGMTIPWAATARDRSRLRTPGCTQATRCSASTSS